MKCERWLTKTKTARARAKRQRDRETERSIHPEMKPRKREAIVAYRMALVVVVVGEVGSGDVEAVIGCCGVCDAGI